MPRKPPFWLSLLILLFLGPARSMADSSTMSQRKAWLIGGSATAYAGGMVGLYQLWYKDYPSSSFHWINDNLEWKQMDKVGHTYSCYQEGRAGIRLFEWAGYSPTTAAWIGGSYGLLMQTTVELFDGHSVGWGASAGDMAANVLGTGLVIGQHLAWQEQRIQLKYSFGPTDYASVRPELLGTSTVEQLFKDYNGQTYWLSVNPSAFAPESIWPSWLNIAVGYGIDGFYGGDDNVFTDGLGQQRDYSGVPRLRQWYLSPDIDLERIPTDNRIVRTALFLLNAVKFPMPALGVDSQGHFSAYPLLF